MSTQRPFLAPLLVLMVAMPPLPASNHREAPITALDHKADITDLYAFVSYSGSQAPNTTPRKVTVILCVDPLLEQANGPTFFPFDPGILYEIKIDNNNDAEEDIVFQVALQTEQRLPGVFTGMVGIGDRAQSLRPTRPRRCRPEPCWFRRASLPSPAPDSASAKATASR